LTTLPLHTYFVDGDALGTTFGYVVGNMLLQNRHYLPGVFEHVPLTRHINGSLWTLPIEATLYFCVAGLGLLRCFRFPWLTSIGIVAVFAYLVLRPVWLGQLPWNGYVQAGFFGVGCMACLHRRHIPVSSGLMLLILIAAVVSRYTTHVMPFTWLAIGYF